MTHESGMLTSAASGTKTSKAQCSSRATAVELALLAREKLLQHEVYGLIDNIERLRLFMEHHVFAVWDFMSLLKRLQRDFTCVTLPWMPTRDAELAKLVNEIVLTEESDRGPTQAASSHLEIYLSAMEEVGADRTSFRTFCGRLRAGDTVTRALATARPPAYVRRFVSRTIGLALNGHTIEVLADFLYGREDIIPHMFEQLLVFWGNPTADVPAFKFYLERHVELDAGDHGPKAQRMLERLIGSDVALYNMANRAARAGICSRIQLWDGIVSSLERSARGTSPS
jgi:hypothetical protein